MDWFKVKVKHCLASDFTDDELGKMIRYQAMISFFERPLTDSERKKIFKKSEEKLSKKLELTSQNSFKVIEDKVLVNCKQILSGRENAKKRKANSRLKLENVTRDIPVTDTVTSQGSHTTERERERERERDKETDDSYKLFLFLFSIWPAERRGNFASSKIAFDVLTSKYDGNINEILYAAHNYLSGSDVEKGMIKSFSKWICEWSNFKGETKECALILTLLSEFKSREPLDMDYRKLIIDAMDPVKKILIGIPDSLGRPHKEFIDNVDAVSKDMTIEEANSFVIWWGKNNDSKYEKAKIPTSTDLKNYIEHSRKIALIEA